MDPANTPTPPADNQPPAGVPPQTPPAGDQTGQPPAGTPPQNPQPPAGGQSPLNWTDSLPDDLKAQESLKVFKDVSGLAKGFIDLKTKLGSYPKIPTDKSTPEEWDKFYTAMGRPENAEGYEITRSDKLPKEILEYEKDSMSKFAAIAHKAGISKAQFKQLLSGYDEITLESTQRAQQDIQLKQQQESEEKTNMLKQKWGNSFDMNMAKAQRAYEFLNPDGTSTNAEIFYKLSEYISEDTYGSGSPAADFINIENQINEGYAKLKNLKESSKEYSQTVEKINALIRQKSKLTSPLH